MKKRKKQEESKTNELTSKQRKFNEGLTKVLDYRTQSSYWDKGNYEDRWTVQRQYAFNYYEDIDQSEGYRSNVKSPEIVGRVQSTLQKMNKFNLEFIARPKRESAKFTAECIQLILNELFRSNKFRYRLRDAYMDMIPMGTAAVGVEWLEVGREVQLKKTNIDDYTEEEVKEFEETGKVPLYKVKMLDFHGVHLINYRLESVYPDPNARSINSGLSRAGYVYVIEKYSKERFDTIFPASEYPKVAEVIPTSPDYNEQGEGNADENFPRTPKDKEGDFVQVVKMYDYDHDCYMIRANNVFILEDVLPYNDKKIPIEMLRGMKVPYQLYGMGLADLLIPIVNQIELLSNAIYDYAMYTSNPMLGVVATEYGDVTRKLAISGSAPGTVIPLQDPSRSMQPIKFGSLSVDIFQALQGLQRDAVIVSQQDPTQLGFMNRKSTATANIINKEITESYVVSLMDTMTEDLESVASMVVSRIHQFMTEEDVSRVVNGEKSEEEMLMDEEASSYEVPIYDQDVDIDWDNRSIKVVGKPKEISFVKIKKDLFEYRDENGKLVKVTPNDFDVFLSAESVEIISRALEKQEAGEMLAQLSPFMVDPSNPAKVNAHPMPLVDATSVMEEVFEKVRWNKKHLLQNTKLEKDSISRAKAQNLEIMRGVSPIAYAGESRQHLQIHTLFHKELINRLDSLTKEIEKMVVNQEEIPNDMKQEFDSISAAVPILSEHIMEDSTPAVMAAQEQAQKGLPQSPMPQGMGNQLVESGPGGNAPLPQPGQMDTGNNPIAQAGMQGGPGQLGGYAGM